MRGVVLLHKGNKIRRPLQLVCPLEIRSCSKETAEVTETTSQEPNQSVSREGQLTMQRRKSSRLQTKNLSLTKLDVLNRGDRE